MRIVDFKLSEMVIVPEADDVGKEFTIRGWGDYHGGAYVRIVGQGIKEEFVRTEVVEDCFMCKGTGTFSWTEKGLFRSTTKNERCDSCLGTGKRRWTRYSRRAEVVA